MGMTLPGCRMVDASAAACDVDYAAIKLDEMVEIDNGLSIYKRFVTENLSEEDLSQEEVASLERMQAILERLGVEVGEDHPPVAYAQYFLEVLMPFFKARNVMAKANG